ncbi:ATP-binding protein [Cupriavidus pampae]|uniref:histidine kinase n=1 Tax=Cupriavidus pampae TaxID=659251 RepID=A0ABM8XYP8_9BURK|nr:ATP-binding protein [Cupriavidus pampae]CAG9185433.1 Adaptive-response sensory-kinase SasA [Cupriavidus pampae]
MYASSFLDARRDFGFEILWEDADVIFGKCRRPDADGRWRPMLVAWTLSDSPAPATLARLAREYDLRDVLDSAWAARPVASHRERGHGVLLLEDPGATPLSSLVGAPMEVDRFLRLAPPIAAALAKLHDTGVLHRHIKPAHVLVSIEEHTDTPTHGNAWLTGFGIATRGTEAGHGRGVGTPQTEIAGTLAYMAPEQTGCMNLSVDARSDLYALGITFYEMLAGTLPFRGHDAKDWVYNHVARQPISVDQGRPWIPVAVAQIVMKLLAKAPEDRYQSAAGLAADLRHCADAWRLARDIPVFPLARHDLAAAGHGEADAPGAAPGVPHRAATRARHAVPPRDIPEAERRVATLLEAGAGACARADLPELATATRTLLELLMTSDQRDLAAAVGVQYLERAEGAWTAHPSAEDVQREYRMLREQLRETLGDRPVTDLLDLPRMTDPVALGTMEVLTSLMPPAWYTDEHLRTRAILRQVNLSLTHGNGGTSALGYAWLAMILEPASGNAENFAFAQLALALADRDAIPSVQARVYQVVGAHVLPWREPLAVATGVLRRAVDVMGRLGDVTHASFIHNNLITHALVSGDALATVQPEAEAGLAYARQARFGLATDRIALQLQLIRTLRGLTPVFGSFDEPGSSDEGGSDRSGFDEDAFARRVSGDKGLALVACWYWIRRLQARFLAGDIDAAVHAAEQAEPLLWSCPSFLEQAEHCFYAALAHAAQREGATDARQRREALAVYHRQLERWAEHCPATFADRAALVGAEIARLDGRDVEAMRRYEVAIDTARDHALVHNQALANELAARFYLSRGLPKVARMYLQEARRCYRHWGADGKVWQLDALYPRLADDEHRPALMGTIDAPLEHLDLATVLEVSLAISREIHLDKLVDTLMRTALEQAGATRGMLILMRDGRPRLAADALASDDGTIVSAPDTGATSGPDTEGGAGCAITADRAPLPLIEQVLASGESVGVDNAPNLSAYMSDPYVQRYRPRSMLCLPLFNQATLVGVLYVENRLAPRVFVPARAAILKLLASQAAVALENSRLYHERRRADAALMQAQCELAHVSRVMTLSALASSIAHEVSQPLAAIIANTSAATRWLRRAPPNLDEAQAALHGVATQSERASAVIAGMRAMLKKTATARACVDLNSVIEDTLPLVRGEAMRQGCTIGMTLATDLPRVAGDRVQLQQVVLNLLMNAIDATAAAHGPNHREATNKSRRRREVLVRTARAEAGGVLVAVHDEGTGLPPEQAEQLFEAFYTTKEHGLGMGLAICRSIVESHAGRLWASPNHPAGAIFQFVIPPTPDVLHTDSLNS